MVVQSLSLCCILLQTGWRLQGRPLRHTQFKSDPYEAPDVCSPFSALKAQKGPLQEVLNTSGIPEHPTIPLSYIIRSIGSNQIYVLLDLPSHISCLFQWGGLTHRASGPPPLRPPPPGTKARAMAPWSESLPLRAVAVFGTSRGSGVTGDLSCLPG